MEGEVVLRRASREDGEAIRALGETSSGAVVWTTADAAGGRSEPGSGAAAEGRLCLVAEEPAERSVVGFLLARTAADEAEILDLAVALSFRRRGVGRRLVGEALAWAGRQGARQCWLEVRASNAAARAFYRALGFREQGRRPRYYRNPEEDALLWVAVVPVGGEPAA